MVTGPSARIMAMMYDDTFQLLTPPPATCAEFHGITRTDDRSAKKRGPVSVLLPADRLPVIASSRPPEVRLRFRSPIRAIRVMRMSSSLLSHSALPLCCPFRGSTTRATWNWTTSPLLRHEPATAALLAAGTLALFLMRRQKSRS